MEQIGEIARRSCVREGIELWDLELAGSGRNRVLRLYIDKPGGVTLDDCELISQQVGTVLDVEDVIPGDSYSLEVSSPGVDRKLRGPDDYVRFAGQKARLVLRQPLDNQRRWEGKLTGFESGHLTLETAPGKTLRIPANQIEKANLKYEW